MNEFFAAPLSGFPSDPTAFAEQVSRLHLFMKLVRAAPASGFPSLVIALLSHVPGTGAPCPAAEPIASAETASAIMSRFI